MPPRRYVLAASLTLALLLGLYISSFFTTLLPRRAKPSFTQNPHFHWSSFRHYTTSHPSSETKIFHLVLPATGPNAQFCRLLLTAGILGFPEPVIVGWQGRGLYNGTESHLFKISETLSYLRSLPASSEEDLVLVLDAYDIFLQLRPDVLIARYWDVLAKNDARVARDGILGKKLAGGVEVRNRVVVGPDKIPWPAEWDDAANWAVPESLLPENSFGPETDRGMLTVRPRWLNSGTILGPAKEMRDVFAATFDMVERKYDEDTWFHGSDQYYFSEVWAEQEVNRRKLKNGGVVDGVPDGGIVPEIPKGRRTEFGICQDHEIDLFQTATAFENHLVWMRFNGSNAKEGSTGLSKKIDEWVLRDDIRQSEAPFSSIGNNGMGWDEVMLGTDSVSQLPFPLYHVTGDKSWLDRHWPDFWFHPHGEELFRGSKKKMMASEQPGIVAFVDGVTWTQGRPDNGDSVLELGEMGGAWLDTGEHVPWEEMCGAYVEELYLRP